MNTVVKQKSILTSGAVPRRGETKLNWGSAPRGEIIKEVLPCPTLLNQNEKWVHPTVVQQKRFLTSAVVPRRGESKLNWGPAPPC